MGTSGLVGQIGTIQAMANSGSFLSIILKIILLQIILPGLISFIIYKIMVEKNLIKDGDLKVEF